MTKGSQIIEASELGGHGLRLIGTTDIDGNGTRHAVEHVDPIVLFDFGRINTRVELPFRPHPHLGLTAMSFLPENGTWMAWDSLKGESPEFLRPGGLYYVHAGSPAFHHEFPSPETVAAAMDVEFVQLVWNATDEQNVETVITQPEDIPVVDLETAEVRVLAGEFQGARSIQPFTHRKILYLYVRLQGGATINAHVPDAMNGILFPMAGNLKVNGASVNAQQMMIFGEDDKDLSISNPGDGDTARFIIAAGEPVNRPFYKLLGHGGFIIGRTEQDVRENMSELSVKAEQLKTEVPQYFPAQYL